MPCKCVPNPQAPLLSPPNTMRQLCLKAFVFAFYALQPPPTAAQNNGYEAVAGPCGSFLNIASEVDCNASSIALGYTQYLGDHYAASGGTSYLPYGCIHFDGSVIWHPYTNTMASEPPVCGGNSAPGTTTCICYAPFSPPPLPPLLPPLPPLPPSSPPLPPSSPPPLPPLPPPLPPLPPPPDLTCGPGTVKNETTYQCEINCAPSPPPFPPPFPPTPPPPSPPTNGGCDPNGMPCGRRLGVDAEPMLSTVEISHIRDIVSRVLTAHPLLEAESLKAASLSNARREKVIRHLSSEVASQLFR